MFYRNKLAHDVLAKLWNGNIPVDIVGILKAYNIELRRLDLPEGVRGKFEVTVNGGVIYYNPQNPLRVNRFMGAHVLGRYLHGHGGIDEITVNNFSTNAHDGRDIAANEFAVALLIPPEALEFFAGTKHCKDANAAADFFAVSPVALGQAIGKAFESRSVPVLSKSAQKEMSIAEDILSVAGLAVTASLGF